MPNALPPSIFNDVVGPVMRGPSSSHSAASVRIGRLARDLCGGQPDRVLIEFDTEGSLATTHESQGSDIGLFSGLLGWEADDERLPRSREALRAAGIELEMRIAKLDDPHPNTYRLTLTKSGSVHRLVALSTGGGMIEVVEIDGNAVSLFGDYAVTLLDVERDAAGVAAQLAQKHASSIDDVSVAGAARSLVVVKAQTFLSDAHVATLSGVARVRRLGPVLPVRSRRGLRVPFLHAGELATRSGSSMVLEAS